MTTDPKLLSLPFDHFGRYETTRRVVSQLWPRRKKGTGLRILDVGGHSSTLKYFLPEAQVVCADPKKRPAFAHRDKVPFLSDAYIQALGGGLPFKDSTFDLVTAHDTLEHVPDSAKERFVRDLFRVARKFVILNGPMMEPLTTEAELRIVSYWRRGLGWRDHPLEEHLENRLPLRKETARLLVEEGTAFAEIPNGNVHLWLTMFALKSYLLTLPDAERLDEVIDRVYNSVIGPRDFGGDCYRIAYVTAKLESGSSAVARVKHDFQSLIESGAGRRANRDLVVTLVSELEEHARHVRTTSGALRETIGNLRKLVEDKEAALRDKDSLLVLTQAALDAKDAALRQMDEVLRQREGLLAKKDALLLDQDALLAERDAALAEMQTRLVDQEKAATEAIRDLETMRGSAGFRLLQGIRRALHGLFPPGSLRGRPYRALLRLTTRLLNRRVRRRSERTDRGPVVTPAEYADWIESWEPTSADLSAQRKRARSLAYRPTFSLLLPVWNPDPLLLRETVKSVLRQTYNEWELCLADGASNKRVREILNSFDDPRIHIRSLPENLGISGNTNEALSMATGEFVVFVDHTDVLAPNALFEAALVLDRDPSLDILYSGHDLITNEGARFNPFFPPSWSPDLLFSVNYLAHLLVMRRSCMEEEGGLRSEFDGAQDWDLLLRVTERTARVARLPGILYHWRTDSTSASRSLEDKPYAAEAQERAVGGALERQALNADVQRTGNGHLKLRWIVEKPPKVSIVIPTRHNRPMLSRLLTALSETKWLHYEILIVDTAGFSEAREEWYRALDAALPVQILWWEEPFNYSAVNNYAASKATGDVLLFLNDDTEPLSKEWLEEMVGWVQREGIGIVGAQLVDEQERIQHGGVVIGLGGFADHLFRGLQPGEWSLMGSTSWYRNLMAVTGACLMIRREVFEAVGGWNEDFVLCGSDVELCLRVQEAGYRVVCTPFASIRHLEGATRGSFVPEEDFATSFWPYQPVLYAGDRYFHPGLSLASTVPALRELEEPGPLEVVSKVLGRDVRPRGPSDPLAEAVGFADRLHATADDVDAVRQLHGETEGRREVTSINWFVPDFESPFYGGIHTIFRFADDFLERHGVKSRFVVIGTGPETYFRTGMRAAFPRLAGSEIHICPAGSQADLEAVPPADVAVSSLWVTSYPLLRFRHATRKFYLVQDFEPTFYPAGTVHALAEETYRMGFYGICNTSTMREIYEDEYGGKAVEFRPAVDPIFTVDGRFDDPDKPFTVFFYGRPGHPRNCYELAIEALRRLKAEMKERVRVVTAGSWAPTDGKDDFVEHLGLLGYEETAELYRRCDAGLVLSVSKHPSYLPMQLMASGCLVVSNVNPAGRWLLRDGENCLLAPPTGQALAAALRKGLLDDQLRSAITDKAVADIDAGFRAWGPEMDRVYEFLCDPEA